MELSPETAEVLQNLLILVFYGTVLVFLLFIVAQAYHWFRYGGSHTLNVLSLSVSLCVCIPLFITMTLLLSLM